MGCRSQSNRIFQEVRDESPSDSSRRTCSTAPMLCAQHPLYAVKLKATAKVEVSMSRRASLFGQATCDGAGNSTFASLHPETRGNPSSPTRLPIQEITPAGMLVTNFRVTDAFRAKLRAWRSSLIRRRVYQAAMVGDDVYVVEFAPDSSVKTSKEAGRWISSFHKYLPSGSL